MSIMITPTVGTVVPLPHLGAQSWGTVTGRSWSQSLGYILRVRENRASGAGNTMLIFGDALSDLMNELALTS